MSMSGIKVCLTGGAGQIAYSLIPILLSEDIFENGSLIDLTLLDIEPCFEKLEGVKMEIEDCNFKYLNSIKISTDAKDCFTDVDLIIFLGGYPRKPGMSRKDVLIKNFEIFKNSGEIVNKYAKPTTKMLVVTNPSNTNCWILDHFTPNIPSKNKTSLSQLDVERLKSLVAKKINVNSSRVENLLIWGNHSKSQVPDTNNLTVNDEKFKLSLSEDEKNLIKERGSTILEKRGLSSSLSAARAIKSHIKLWYSGTEYATSFGVKSSGEYNFPKDLFITLPVTIKNSDYSVIMNLNIENIKNSINESINELVEENKIVKTLL